MTHRELIGLCPNDTHKQNTEFMENNWALNTRTRSRGSKVKIDSDKSSQQINNQEAKKQQEPMEQPQIDIEPQVVNRGENIQHQIQEQFVSLQNFQILLQTILTSPENYKNSSKNYDMQLLYNIARVSQQNGGIVKLSSIGQFQQIIQNIHQSNNNNKKSNIENLNNLSKQEINQIRQIIFSYEFCDQNKDAKVKLYELGLVNFVDCQQLKKDKKNIKKGLKYLEYDLTLFQRGAEAYELNEKFFNLEYICQHYQDQSVDIRIQNPCDYGFDVSKLQNTAYQMTIGEYRYFQQNFNNQQKLKDFMHYTQLQKGQTFFAVNFEPRDQLLNTQLKKSFKKSFLDFHSSNDLLSYMDAEVPGCSSPQMYFKTPGVWTGGHQQNINMSALNINHGPDASEWYTLDLKQIGRLRQQLIREYNMDLYENQGLWYQSLEWFIKNQYPVKKFLQRKDDIVVTGPGTLHWVRSHGVALQSSWNLMPKTFLQLETAFIRVKQNKQIKFQKANTIPLKSLIVKFLNHQRTTIQQGTLKLCAKQLQEWLNEELALLPEVIADEEQAGIPDQIAELSDFQSFCYNCKQQITIFYVPLNLKFTYIRCLSCQIAENSKNDKKNSQSVKSKYAVSNLKELISRCYDAKKNQEHPQQIGQLCRGVHIGETAQCLNTYKSINIKKARNQKYRKTKKQLLQEQWRSKQQSIQPIDPQKPQYHQYHQQNQQNIKDEQSPSPLFLQKSVQIHSLISAIPKGLVGFTILQAVQLHKYIQQIQLLSFYCMNQKVQNTIKQVIKNQKSSSIKTNNKMVKNSYSKRINNKNKIKQLNDKNQEISISKSRSRSRNKINRGRNRNQQQWDNRNLKTKIKVNGRINSKKRKYRKSKAPSEYLPDLQQNDCGRIVNQSMNIEVNQQGKKDKENKENQVENNNGEGLLQASQNNEENNNMSIKDNQPQQPEKQQEQQHKVMEQKNPEKSQQVIEQQQPPNQQ